MNTLQNVYDRLQDKTELAKHEVELGLIDELNKKASEAKIIFDAQHNAGVEIAKAQAMLFNALNSKNDKLKKYITVIKDVETLMAKQEIMYKELGLSIREDKAYKNAWAINEHFSAKTAEFYINTVKDLLTQKKYIQ